MLNSVALEPFNNLSAFIGQKVKHNGRGTRKGYVGEITDINSAAVGILWVRGRDGIDLGSRPITSTFQHSWAESNLLVIPDEVKPHKAEAQYIIWCPSSDKPPRKIMTSASADQALIDMANAYPSQVFFKCRLERKAVTQSLLVEEL